ncbi:hypothetical protein [Bradyrhizobium elkanii]|uniref:hypothetical protein n=1 Tax=Bradyrhizobium elkanii TaxID=29448 RepID=UPI001FDA005D|nr:hypothetical protein [Bradyrhizobium elkanii]
MLEAIFEADFEGGAYGYRPGKSVARRIVDRNVLRLIKLWLRVPVEERDSDGKRRMSDGKSNKRGTPQGVSRPPLT